MQTNSESVPNMKLEECPEGMPKVAERSPHSDPNGKCTGLAPKGCRWQKPAYREVPGVRIPPPLHFKPNLSYRVGFFVLTVSYFSEEG